MWSRSVKGVSNLLENYFIATILGNYIRKYKYTTGICITTILGRVYVYTIYTVYSLCLILTIQYTLYTAWLLGVSTFRCIVSPVTLYTCRGTYLSAPCKGYFVGDWVNPPTISVAHRLFNVYPQKKTYFFIINYIIILYNHNLYINCYTDYYYAINAIVYCVTPPVTQ